MVLPAVSSPRAFWSTVEGSASQTPPTGASSGASPQLTLAIHIDAPEAEYTGDDRVQSMTIRAPEWDAMSASAGVMVQLPLR